MPDQTSDLTYLSTLRSMQSRRREAMFSPSKINYGAFLEKASQCSRAIDNRFMHISCFAGPGIIAATTGCAKESIGDMLI